MRASKIIQEAALLSGRGDIADYIEATDRTNFSKETSKACNQMVTLLNMMISELCTSFIPMIATEKIYATDKIEYDKLSKNAVEILKIYDAFGKEVDFKIDYDHVKISSPCAKVVYKFHPKTYALTDNIDYEEKDISGSVLAYGLAAEFALTEGDFDRACSFHDRYVEGVHAISKPKNSTVKQRSWV